jgi:hypothetical protein
MHRVAGAGVDRQACVRDTRDERVLVGARAERVLVAPDDEGGSRDVAQLGPKVGFDEVCEDGAPDARGDFQAFRDERVEEGGRDRLRQGALLEFAGEGRIDWIGEGRNRLLPECDDRGVGPVRGERAEEDQT